MLLSILWCFVSLLLVFGRQVPLLRRLDWHIMVLGVDSMDKLIAAAHFLHSQKIAYIDIQSSPGHYWVVTDYVSSFRSALNLARKVPGVDDQYLNLCEKHDRFILRGIRKPGAIPEFKDYKDFPNSHVRQWLSEFEELFEHQEMNRSLALMEALRVGEVADMAADPAFEV